MMMSQFDPKVRAQTIFNEPVDNFIKGTLERTRLRENATVRDVLERFRGRAGAVVVVNERDELVGILTPSDMDRIVEEFRKNQDTNVQKVMTRNPVFVETGEPLTEALVRMKQHQIITGLPVINRSSRKYEGFLLSTRVKAELDTLSELLR